MWGYSFALKDDFDIEYRVLPEKIHKNDIITLEVFKTSGGKILIEKIPETTVESLDNSIISVTDVSYSHDYKTLVTLQAKNEGSAIIYVYSEGLKSLEIPLTVNGNNLPNQLSLDIFPKVLDVDDNNQGILTVFLSDENGRITRADKDYLVKLDTSKSDVISWSEPNMIISKGEFAAKQKFSVIKPGIITINAMTDDLEDSESLTIDDAPERTIEAYVIPSTISSTKTSNGNLIAQLFSEDKLVTAPDDITVFYEIYDDSEELNSSSDVTTPNPKGYFLIKKGQTWGHHSFSIQKGIVDSYNLKITSQDPLVVLDEMFDTVGTELYGNDQIKFSTIPVLADGNRQLIGVLYLEDENGHPVSANQDIIVPFTSSNQDVFIETAVIKKGFDYSLVYGNVGYFIPSDKNIAAKIQNSELVELDIHGFEKESVSLETHVFSDTVLNGERFWMLAYMESSDGNLFKLPKDYDLRFSDSKIFSIDTDNIKNFPYFSLIPITAIDTGYDEITVSRGDFETDITLFSVSSKPNVMEFDYSGKLFEGISDSFMIQILDSQLKPIQINEDISVKIFSSDPSIIEFPKEVTIKSKSSFVKFDLIPAKSGTIEISLISEGLPIVTEEIAVSESSPTIEITSNDTIDEGESFIVSILAKYNGIPLQNAQVEWDFEGGFSTIFDEQTGPTGEAVASIIATSDESVNVHASVGKGPIKSAFVSKTIQVNSTQLEIANDVESEDSFKKPDLGGFDPVLILVPALIGGTIFYMKKKSR